MFATATGRIIIGLAILIVASLQYAYWFGESGYFMHEKLINDMTSQIETNQELSERNRILAAEVYDLKNGYEAIEEHARLDLGLVKPHETFVQMSMISGAYQPIYLNDREETALERQTNESE
uniref:septum formation initiator family protein n=1 Tax=uncultured Acinetobacter sp. TaxID=165433 RepID=UPI002623C6AA|nr:septum formation initiator family protein [uncultured Acinetobacter sp.]